MSLRILATNMIVRKMSIYLRRRYARMTEHFLNVPKTRTAVQQMGGETVSQHVWSDLRRNPDLSGKFVEP